MPPFLQKIIDKSPFLTKVYEILDLYGSRRMGRSAAAFAYYLMLSFFPLLICVASIIGRTRIDTGELLELLSEDEKPTPTPTVAPTPTPTKEPVQTDETEPKQDGTVVAGTLMLAILGGGAFWYLKQRKKKESKPQPSYDEYEDDEDDEPRDDDLNE